jgi:hypothetical protein
MAETPVFRSRIHNQGWMVMAEPGVDGGLEFAGEVAEFVRLGLTDGAGDVVFGGVALGAACVELAAHCCKRIGISFQPDFRFAR